MRGVLIYRLRVCWRLLWFSVILTMLVLCGLVVFHLLPEKDCRLFKTSLLDLFRSFQTGVILAIVNLALATCCLWNIELPN